MFFKKHVQKIHLKTPVNTRVLEVFTSPDPEEISFRFLSLENSGKTSENTLREFPLVIATVAKVSCKRGLWLVVRVNTNPPLTSAVCPEIRVCGQEWEGDFLYRLFFFCQK